MDPLLRYYERVNFDYTIQSYQQHCLNLLLEDVAKGYILRSYDILIPTVCSEISPVSNSLRIFSAKMLKAVSTFLYYFALIYRKFNPSCLAKILPYSVVTCLYDYKSILLPTNKTCIATFPFAFTSYSHSCKCSNV